MSGDRSWLVTGGAGYIGAHVVRELQATGSDVVVVDDLSTGERGKVPAGASLTEASVRDAVAMRRVLRDHQVTGVVHLAAKKAVGESVVDPLLYYRENVDGLLTVLEAMVDTGVEQLVYSSSAAVYGDNAAGLVAESARTEPISPYGHTKLIGEWAVAAATVAYPIRAVALRYFNVAGAGADDLGDTGVHNLIPLVLRAAESGVRPRIYGDDYPTSDGTCVRDYVHVADLAAAHRAAGDALNGDGGFRVYNVGRGVGSSVREVIDVVARVIGRDLDPQVVGRRPGDPAQLVGSVDAIATDLGWRATQDLDDMVTSAWSARKAEAPT